MPPYAPSYLKRKFGGRYSNAAKRPRYNARVRSALVRRVFSSTPASRYAAIPRTIELKYADAGASVGNTSSGHITNLFAIQNGTGPDERIGRSVSLHDMNVNYRIATNGNALYSLVRVMIIYDKQTNGALPAITDIVASTGTVTQFNANNRSRFMILYDRSHTGAASSETTASLAAFADNPTVVNKKISLKGKKTEFDGTTTNISDIEKGAIYLLVLANNSSTLINYTTRIQYMDI